MMSDKPAPRSQSRSSMRAAILQRVCTRYRLGLFEKLAERADFHVRLLYGQDMPSSKVKSVPKIDTFDSVQLPTRWHRFWGRPIPEHIGLREELKRYQPDIILTEGESNVLSARAALKYKNQSAGRVEVIHWSLGGLPGRDPRRNLVNWWVSRFRKKFDRCLAYSTFGKNCLIHQGIRPEKITVAVNVCDTSHHLKRAIDLKATRTEARERLGIPNRFTALYAGAVDSNKRLDVLVRAAALSEAVQIVIVGDGPEAENIRRLGNRLGMASRLFMPGRVSDELPLYFRSANVFGLPGRGGVVLSESMCYQLPILAYQADGTEYDLLEDGVNGYRLANGTSEEFRDKFEYLFRHPDLAKQMGLRGRERLISSFTQEHMIRNIIQAITSHLD